MAGDGQGVEETGAGEESVVSRADDRGEDHGVDEGSGGFSAGHLEYDGEGGGGGFLAGEVGVVVGDVEADEEDGEDVEDEDAPEDVLYDPGEVLGGVLGFPGSYRDGFCAAVWKGVSFGGCEGLEPFLHANDAVTKTDAKPPIPPTKGASPMYQ